MTLQEFARNVVNEDMKKEGAGLLKSIAVPTKRFISNLTGSRVKGVEAQIAQNDGHIFGGMLDKRLVKAKAAQRSSRIIAGVGAGGLAAGHLLTKKDDN